jgi:hypothetical protein
MKLLIVALAAALLCSCGTNVADVRAQVEQAKVTITTLAEAAAQLNALAESSGDKRVIEMAAAASQALAIAQTQLPEMEAQLAQLEDSAPGWKVALAALWPLLMTGVRMVPGIGGIAAPIANALWAITATKKQKLADQGL